MSCCRYSSRRRCGVTSDEGTDVSECGVYVEGHGSFASFPCSLDKNHDGPHATDDIPSSKRKREQWDKENTKMSEPLDVFQPEFQTTAQRLTENPTEHPDVVKRREQESSDPVAPATEPAPSNELTPLAMVAPNPSSFAVGTTVGPDGKKLAVIRAETVTGSQVYFFTPESLAALHQIIGQNLSALSSRLVIARDLPPTP